MSERKLLLTAAYFKKYSNYFKILLIFLSVAIPFALLYYIDAPSFDKTWTGRTYYLFFVWLLVLEFVLDWDKYGSKTSNNPVKSKFAFGLALTLPTCYVIISNFFGLNAIIIDMGRLYGTPWLDAVPLAVEYIVFTVLFAAIILLAYKLKGLTDFLLPLSLLGVIGAIYAADILWPYGQFVPFQILVPITATLSANVLNLMGYQTRVVMDPGSPAPILSVERSEAFWGASIVWPCAGIESLLIYTVVILLFFKKANIPLLHRVIYFIIGAVVTYFINILRIVTICIIGINNGDFWAFHDYYGQLYSTIWIVSYPLIIIGSRTLWSKLKSSNSKEAIVRLKSSGTDKTSV